DFVVGHEGLIGQSPPQAVGRESSPLVAGGQSRRTVSAYRNASDVFVGKVVGGLAENRQQGAFGTGTEDVLGFGITESVLYVSRVQVGGEEVVQGCLNPPVVFGAGFLPYQEVKIVSVDRFDESQRVGHAPIRGLKRVLVDAVVKCRLGLLRESRGEAIECVLIQSEPEVGFECERRGDLETRKCVSKGSVVLGLVILGRPGYMDGIELVAEPAPLSAGKIPFNVEDRDH